VRSVVIYCADYRCAHSTTALADGWPDDIRLSDIEDRFVCKACGRRGADVRPLFEPTAMGIGRLEKPAGVARGSKKASKKT
jgi:hypothetical protein